MKNLIHPIAYVIFFWTILTFNASAQDMNSWLHEGPILLKNITIIDGLGHDAKPMRDVLIQDGKIARITVTTMMPTLPEGTLVIDSQGLTVLPGLMDTHTHLMNIDYSKGVVTGDEFAKMNGLDISNNAFNYALPTDDKEGREGVQRYLNADLYAGVTTVLDVGTDMDIAVTFRDDLASGKRMGPTIHTVGDTVTAMKTTETAVDDLHAPLALAEIQEIFDAREKLGIKHLKIYAGVTAWEARHLMHEAKKRGFKIIADMWGSNLSRDFMEISGINGYAHGGMLKMTPDDAAWMAANGKFATLTLNIFDNQRGLRGYKDYTERSFLNNSLIVDVYGRTAVENYYKAYLSLQQQWNENRGMYDLQLWGDKTRNLAFNMENLRVLLKAGVMLGMGTDAAYPPGSWPGEAMHYELELTVQAGVKPVEAIKMATHNNASYIGILDKVGTVESGKIADLLIVKGNPAENISDTRNIEYVIKGGKLVNRDALKFRQ
jgi:cytosine/adenosine deaminase-related metal-dependent hydrolase